ncbi:hypothetical protein PM082_006169 [Marasmius tenuissimus]|nr:hypothetical protein PM082_006169 [Marasmius tenuissimus]
MESPFNSQTVEHMLLNKMVTLASFTVLIYDIFLTLDDEVQYIWIPLHEGYHPVLNWMTVMWCVNRYLCPAYMVVIIFLLLHDPQMSTMVCEHYVWYPQVMWLIVTSATSVYFVKLVQALWSRHLYAIILTYLLLAAEVAVKIWAITDIKGTYYKECTGCFISSRMPQHPQYVYGYGAELVFDSLMLATTAIRCWQLRIERTKFIKVIWKESMIFLPAVFAIHLANVLLTIYATIPLKNIMTSFSSVGCTIIVSRMILNTRKAMDPEYDLTIGSRLYFCPLWGLAFMTIPPSAEVEEQEERMMEPSPQTWAKKVDLESYPYSGTHKIVTFRALSAEAGDSEWSMTETRAEHHALMGCNNVKRLNIPSFVIGSDQIYATEGQEKETFDRFQAL